MRVLRLFPAVLLGLAFAGPASAQSSESLKASAEAQADTLIARYRADYAVPDAPALTLLGLDGSELVRPSTVRDLTVGITDFVGDNGQFRIPRAFAVEFAPGLLFFGRKLTLAQYQKHPVLYRLRISAATQRIEGSGTASSVAFAIRTSPIDGADLRTNGFIAHTAAPIALAVGNIDSVAEARADAARLRVRDSLTTLHASPEEIRAAVHEVPSAIYLRADQAAIDSLVGIFRSAADSARDDSWQRQALDLAVGLRLDARDSTGSDLKAGQVAAWLTYAGGVADWAQWVVGAKMASARDSVSGKYRVEASLATRWYAGSNRYKVFVDFQGTKTGDQDAEWLLASGTEINVLSRVWATASLGGGWGPETGDGKIRLKFGLRAAMPGR